MDLLIRRGHPGRPGDLANPGRGSNVHPWFEVDDLDAAARAATPAAEVVHPRRRDRPTATAAPTTNCSDSATPTAPDGA